MSQLYCTGRVTSELELKTSAKQVPYLCFPIMEYVGYGRNTHPQYLSVWAWGATARQLVEDGVGKGSVLWVSGSLELEESLEKYALGVQLLAELQKRLGDAEQKVEVLMGELEDAPDDEVRDSTLQKA